MDKTREYALSLLVENNAGVLSRVALLFSRRGYNINSLTVGETADPRVSRMTIFTSGDEYIIDQIYKQLEKLEETICIELMDMSASVFRELMLIKVSCCGEDRARILELCNVFHAKISDISQTTATVEVSGAPGKNAALIDLLSEFGIIELVRTGVAGIQRGAANLEASLKDRRDPQA